MHRASTLLFSLSFIFLFIIIPVFWHATPPGAFEVETQFQLWHVGTDLE